MDEFRVGVFAHHSRPFSIGWFKNEALSCSLCPYCERRVDVAALTAIVFANPGCCSFLKCVRFKSALSRRFAMSKLGCSLLAAYNLRALPAIERGLVRHRPNI